MNTNIEKNGWHAYQTEEPIKWGWESLSTKDQTEATLRDLISKSTNDVEVRSFEDKLFELRSDWESAQTLAKAIGWEGDVRGEPAVFWAPSEGGFRHGFVFVQENNGTSFVVSPCEMPHLVH